MLIYPHTHTHTHIIIYPSYAIYPFDRGKYGKFSAECVKLGESRQSENENETQSKTETDTEKRTRQISNDLK